MFGGVARKAQAKAVVAKAGSEALEVDESLSALERIRHFGNSKQSLQRLVFVNELVDCAHEVGYEATVSHLIPLVKKLASDSEVLVRQSLVGHFGDLAGFLIQSDPEKGYQKVVDEVLPVVSKLLYERPPTPGEPCPVRQGAADALTALASHLRPGERGDRVLMTVISLSHSNDDEDARSTAVQLLNGLAEALGQELCHQFVAVQLVALSEDMAFRVRKATASNFAEVCRVVGDDCVMKRMLPAFTRLIHDQHWGVRKAAAESLVGFAQSMRVESREASLVPQINDLLKDASRWVRISTLQQLGYFIATLETASRVPQELLTQYVDIIEQTKANPDAADISYHCAYTFAAVTKTMGPAHWTVLQVPFISLCRDQLLKPRKAMAASVHIVAQTLGPEMAEKEVLPQFEALLQDKEQDVRISAVRNVANILRAAPKMEPQRRTLKAFQTTMAKAENWRLRGLAAAQLGAICEALREVADSSGSGDDSDAASAGAGVSKDSVLRELPAHAKELTRQVIVPLFLQFCSDSVAEVRDEAARVTSRVLRAAAPELFADAGSIGEGSSGCSSGDVRQISQDGRRLVRRLIQTFAKGRSFRERMAYIRMCDSVVRESPPRFFMDLLLRPLIDISKDSVKNVRLCWATTMLPHVRKGGRLSQNRRMVDAVDRMSKAEGQCIEVCRVLAGAPLALELLSQDGQSDLGPESDLGDSDREIYLGAEGGTGDSSECSDVGVGEEESVEDSSEAPSGPTLAAISVSSEPEGMREEASAGGFQPQPRSPSEAHKAPVLASTSSPTPTSPGGMKPTLSPTSGGTAAPAFDPVEDGLVEQRDLEQSMDSTFSSRRLLHEVEAEAVARAEAAEETDVVPDVERENDVAEPGKAVLSQAAAKFEELDLDGDGRVTREEFEAARGKSTAATFEEIDINRDGEISKQEMISHEFSKSSGSSASEQPLVEETLLDSSDPAVVQAAAEAPVEANALPPAAVTEEATSVGHVELSSPPEEQQAPSTAAVEAPASAEASVIVETSASTEATDAGNKQEESPT